MDYFQISAQDLGKNAKIPVVKLGDSGEVFYELALEMVNTAIESIIDLLEPSYNDLARIAKDVVAGAR